MRRRESTSCFRCDPYVGVHAMCCSRSERDLVLACVQRLHADKVLPALGVEVGHAGREYAPRVPCHGRVRTLLLDVNLALPGVVMDGQRGGRVEMDLVYVARVGEELRGLYL